MVVLLPIDCMYLYSYSGHVEQARGPFSGSTIILRQKDSKHGPRCLAGFSLELAEGVQTRPRDIFVSAEDLINVWDMPGFVVISKDLTMTVGIGAVLRVDQLLVPSPRESLAAKEQCLHSFEVGISTASRFLPMA